MKKVILPFLTFLPFFNSVYSQDVNVKGVVTDAETNSPLPGVNVVAKEASTIGAVTNGQGEFELSVPPSVKNLTFSFVGYQSKEVPVSQEMKVTLTPGTALDQVVIIGYGTVKKKDLTGSVASVEAKDIAVTPVPDVAQAMQGKLPGVNVVSQDGRPGAEVSIRVRGGGSISQSNQPLILIDGVPGTLSNIPADEVKSIDVLKDASSTAIYGARGANGVILVTTKGAESGKTKISYDGYVKFNTPTRYLKTLNPVDYLSYVWENATANGAAYADPFAELYGLGQYAGSTGGLESYRNVKDNDIQKEVYNSSVSWNHNLTVTGGTERTKMYLSANYTKDQGMKLNSYFNRANLNFKVDQKLLKNVTFKLNTRYVDIRAMDDEGTTSGSGSLLSSSYQFRPIATEDIHGNLDALRKGNVDLFGKTTLWDSYSPYERIGDYDPLSLANSLRGIGTLNWEIIKGLNVSSELSLNKSWSQRKYWSGAIFNNYIDDDNGEKLFAGDVDYRKNDSWGLRWANTVNYDFSIHKIHSFNVLAGQELTNSGGTGMSILASHFPANFDKNTAFAQINQFDPEKGSASFSSDVTTPERIESYFGRINYTLEDKYLATFTFRADGSSKFSPLNRWGYFPAGAVAWRISEENFLKDANWIDNLKLRVSLGEVGNDGINSDLWSQTWASVSDQRLMYTIDNARQPSYDLSSSSLANLNLKWETTITRDLGLDFSFLEGRLAGTLDFYKNTTKDLLMLTTIPGVTGFTSTFANVGQTSNKGGEFSLTGTIIKNKDWDVTFGGNISFNKGNVDRLSPGVTGLYGSTWFGTQGFPSDDYILIPGQPVGLVRGLTYEGFYTPEDFDYNNGTYTLKKGVPDLNPDILGVVHGLSSSDRAADQIAYPGLPKFKDLNGDGVIDVNDVSVIGNMNPVHTGGFNLNASFKRIDFGAYFNWSYGNKIYNANKLAGLYGPKEAGVYENKLAILKDAYQIYSIQNNEVVRLTTPEELNEANQNTKLPLAYNEMGVVSSLGIEDGSYLRLNTLSLGYTIPKNLSKKAGIENFRIYGTVYNVLTLTGYSGLDPEVSSDDNHNHAIYPTTGLDYGTYPRARSFVLGLNVQF